MIECHGNLFDSDAPALGHGVNCAGVMGAGIATAFRDLYPHNYENYRAACLAGFLKPGQITVNRENDKYIVNMASQNKPGRDATYPWLFEAAYTAAKQAVDNGIDRIAIPEIGCGIGGLVWDNVETVLLTTEYLVNTPGMRSIFDWEVWHYAG